jgi:hypothetical protein
MNDRIFWPEASLSAMQRFGRLRVRNGHGATIAKWSIVTHHVISGRSFAVVHNMAADGRLPCQRGGL